MFVQIKESDSTLQLRTLVLSKKALLKPRSVIAVQTMVTASLSLSPSTSFVSLETCISSFVPALVDFGNAHISRVAHEIGKDIKHL